MGRGLSTELECKEEELNNQLFWNVYEKEENKSAYNCSIISECVMPKTTCISMFNESGDIVKSPEETRQRHALYSWAHEWSVLLCVYGVCALRDTHALHGSPGSGSSSVGCAALGTKLMWRCLSPAMHRNLTLDNIDKKYLLTKSFEFNM